MTPSALRACAVSKPMPVDAPVTKAMRSVMALAPWLVAPARWPSTRSGTAKAGSSQRIREEPALRWNLVGVDGRDFGLVFAPQRVERTFGINAAVGVRTEEVALALDQCSGNALAAQAVVVRQRGGEDRYRDAQLDGGGYNAAPGREGLGDGLGESRREQEVGRLLLGRVGLGDVLEEFCADDATCAPQRGDLVQLEVPAVLLGSGGQHVQALGVGNQLGGVQRLADVLNERLGDLHGSLFAGQQFLAKLA